MTNIVFSNDYYIITYRAQVDSNPVLKLLIDNLKFFNGRFLGDKINIDIHAYFRDTALDIVKSYLNEKAFLCVKETSIQFKNSGETYPLFSKYEIDNTYHFFHVTFHLNDSLPEVIREKTGGSGKNVV